LIVAVDASPLVSDLEIVEITGGYKRAADQYAELQRQGFWRARRSRMDGRVILERAHYEAVCRGVGQVDTVASSVPAPTVLP
jgi:hypothetical protein